MGLTWVSRILLCGLRGLCRSKSLSTFPFPPFPSWEIAERAHVDVSALSCDKSLALIAAHPTLSPSASEHFDSFRPCRCSGEMWQTCPWNRSPYRVEAIAQLMCPWGIDPPRFLLVVIVARKGMEIDAGCSEEGNGDRREGPTCPPTQGPGGSAPSAKGKSHLCFYFRGNFLW